MHSNRLLTQIACQISLLAGSVLQTGCSEPQKNQASFCLAWMPACAAAVATSVVPREHPFDPQCTHEPPTTLPDHSVEAEGVALLDIDALPWFGVGYHGEGYDGTGSFDVVEIGGALVRSHFQYFELKAPADYKGKGMDQTYTDLAQGRHPNYLRVSIKSWGSPGCELYQNQLQQPHLKHYMQGNGMKDDQCIAVEDEESPSSRYGFDVFHKGTADIQNQIREIVDLSNQQVYARYNRKWYPGDDCPLPQVRQQFMDLIHPVAASTPPQ